MPQVRDTVVLTDSIGANFSAVDVDSAAPTSDFGGQTTYGFRRVQAPALPRGTVLELRTFREVGAAATADPVNGVTDWGPGWEFEVTRRKYFDLYTSLDVAFVDLQSPDWHLHGTSGDLGHVDVFTPDDPALIPALPDPIDWVPGVGQRAHVTMSDLRAQRDLNYPALRLGSGQAAWFGYATDGSAANAEYVTLATHLPAAAGEPVDYTVGTHFWDVLHTEPFGEVFSDNGWLPPSPTNRAAIYLDGKVVPKTEWVSDGGDGAWWGNAGCWDGGIASGPAAVAWFGPAITQDRAVVTDAPWSVGAIVFDNAAHRYTLAKGNFGAITLDAGGTEEAWLNVRQGSHTIAAPLTLADDLRITVTPPAATLTISGPFSVNAGVDIIKDGQGCVVVPHVNAATLTIEAGTVDVAAGSGTGTPGTSRVEALAIAAQSAGARLDLNDNRLIIAGGNVGTSEGSTYSGLSGLIQSGFNSGAWDGPGIATGMPEAVAGLTSLGIATAEDAGYAGGTFGGVSVSSGDVLIMYTYAGDANLDGFISGDDYSAIDFAIAVPGAGGWASGDFNYDGIISGDDYTVIDFNIVAQGDPFPTGTSSNAVVAVPEPLAVLPAAAAVLFFGRRRRR